MTHSILITGCSSGIGLSTALLLKQRGYRVFAAVRKASDIEKLKAQGIDEAIPLDVTNAASRVNAIETILQITGGTLDALFNNAGFLVAGAIEDVNDEWIRTQFETNVFGVIALTRLILPIMRKQGHGRIIQNSSILGIITMPYYGVYNASKFALEGFSNTLRQELHGTGIHVSIINPGPIYSKLRDHSFDIYQQTLAKQDSLHRHAYQKLEKSYFHPNKKNRRLMYDPKIVVKAVIHALESRHSHIHYYIGFPIKLLVFLKRILPEHLFDWLLMKI
ncbi:MAG TPA: SDR family NAD(P)-dependent oxidoreductase [Gammaproteobacteria bacterium]|nr:SDR family NAD(P)-dependent oxidoreductase [Gammaproteobacteria bacterium]